MKKHILLIAVALMSATAFAQNNVMNKGDFMMNIGIGVGGSGYLSDGYGFLPGINVSGEIGMFPTGDIGIVTLGGIVAMKFNGYDYFGVTGSSFGTAVMFRGAWHLSVLNNTEWDVYAGTGVGFRYVTFKYDNGYASNYSETDVVVSLFVGGRWMMKDNFGFFAELGYDALSNAKAGITFKF